MSNYWNTVTSQRLNRRRLLASTGATVAGAAFLAACGGESTKQQSSGLVASVVDETKNPKRGGIHKYYAQFEFVHLDPQQSGSQPGPAEALYSTLWRIKDGYLGPSSGEIEGDVVDTWEISADQLTITAKINPNAHFAPVAPVNGRSVDANDVVASWNRWSQIGTYAIEVINAKSPEAPVLSVHNPDDRTVVMKLKEPNATVFALLTQVRPGNFFVIPREAVDTKLVDIRNTVVGSGPWMLKDWQPGAGIFYKRNPGFKQDKRGDIVYVDEVELPTVTEAAVGIAQFRAGAIYDYPDLVEEQVLQTKRDLPQLNMMSTILPSSSSRQIFGHLPESPFKDERVRRAWVMTWDRDLLIDVMYGVPAYRNEGIPVKTGWDTAVKSSTYEGWWLDPQSSEFGPNGKYFKHDLAEAKKLLTAAGFPNGIDTVVHYPQSGYPADRYKLFEISHGMVRDSGLFRFSVDQVNYNTEWTPRYRNIRGQIPDVAMINDTGSLDPTVFTFSKHHSTGSLFQGGDATMDDLMIKAVREFDVEKRKALLHEAQRYEGGMMHFPATHGSASNFTLSWPVVRNRNVWQGGTVRAFGVGIWLDPEQEPIKRA